MIQIKLQDAHISVNGIRLVNLREPFQRIVNCPDGPSTLLRPPSQTLARTRKPLTYYVPMTSSKAGALYNMELHTLQSHWVYSTNTSVSPVFRDKALQTVLHNLDEQENIRKYLEVVVGMLTKSYSFDAILTTIPHLNLMTSIPIIGDTTKLVKLPGRRFETRRYRTVRALLDGHKGLPARLFDWEVFTEITSRHTTLDKKRFREYSSIMVLVGTNVQYAGWLTNELLKLRNVKEVLPVSMFYIGGRK